MAGAADSLDILIRVQSDVAGAQQAKRALDDVNNVIRASPADIAKATKATEELETSHRDLHRAARELGREMPVLGEVMHTSLFGPVAIIATLVSSFAELRSHVSQLHDDVIKAFSDDGVTRLIDYKKALHDIAEQTRKTVEENAKWHADLVRNADEMVQKLDANLGRLKEVADQSKQLSDLNKEVAEAHIQRQQDLGLLTPEAAIAEKLKASESAAQSKLTADIAANAGERKSTEYVMGVEERKASMAGARLRQLEAQENSPEFQRAALADGSRNKRIESNAKTITEIQKILAQEEAGVHSHDDSQLPEELKRNGKLMPTWIHDLRKALGGDGLHKGLMDVQNIDIRQQGERAAQLRAFDQQKQLARDEEAEAKKKADSLNQRLKSLELETEALKKKGEALKMQLEPTAAKLLGELRKTPEGGVFDSAATAEGIVTHQSAAAIRIRGGDVYDANLGRWRARRAGEAKTTLTEAQQNDLTSASGFLHQLSPKDQRALLDQMHLQKAPGKSFEQTVLDYMNQIHNNSEQFLSVVTQLIQFAKSHGAKIVTLNAQLHNVASGQ